MPNHVPPARGRQQGGQHQQLARLHGGIAHDHGAGVRMEAPRLIAGYHDTRLAPDPRRDAVWKALWRYYFRYRIRATDSVLDLGAGYGDFINNVVAARRIAVDVWPGMVDQLDKDVEAIVGPVTDLSEIADGSVDYAFASNLFE